MNEFLRLMAEEAAEQAVHQHLERELTEGAGAGESGKAIAKRSLKGIFGAAGPVMALARTMPGFTLPLAGSAVAALLKKSDFVERILPGDTRPVVREAKLLLKEVGPHALLGVFTGYADAASQIDREVDAARSDPGVADADANQTLDWVVVSRLVPGKIFVPARDSDGKIRVGADQVPVILDPTWALYKSVWDDTHKATTKQVGGGKGQQPRTERVPAESFPHEVLKLAEAIAQMGDTQRVSAVELKILEGLLRKPAEWWEAVGPEVRRFFLLISRSVRQGTALQYALREDIVKDVVDKKGVPFLRTLAEYYNPRATPEDRFNPEDLDDIIAAFDTALGAELTLWHKALRGASSAWHNRGAMSGTLKALLYGSAVGIVVFNLATVVMFLTAFWWMLSSLFSAPSMYHSLRAIICATVLIIMFFTLRIWQRLLHPLVVSVLGWPADWLAEFGWRFTFMLMPAYLIALGLIPEVGVSLSARVVILGLAFVGVCIGMGFKVAGAPAKAQLLALRGAQYGWLVTIGIIAADWMIRHGWPQAVWGATVAAWGASLSFLGTHQWVASAVLFTLVYLPGYWLVRRLAQTRVQSGSILNVTQGSNPLVGHLAVFLCALMVAVSVPWFVGHHTMDPFATTPPTSSSARSASKPHTHTNGVDCAALSYEGRQAFGCK
ncbi:hypothetical protein HZA85_01670 [Candidatus Uhrbacteria bacterium]|nr:hypothetical protein [Candidatus Uhrbacteria bacterium]